MSKKQKGLYKKYKISKVDGGKIDPKAEYFVLRIDKDPHALNALKEYAFSVSIQNTKLSNDLWELIDKYDKR